MTDSAVVQSGCDILRSGGFSMPAGAGIGLLSNQASVSSSLEHVSDVILGRGASLECLFGPQHGPEGLTQANMIEWDNFTDPRLGIPVYSLYGETRSPRREMLEGLDIVVIDLQDVGARPYTYIWTALLMIEACAEAGVKAIVLDRPNPLGGMIVEGPVLEKGYESFVGLRPLPMRHGMTMGEILLAAGRKGGGACDLEIVRMEGWRRRMPFCETGLPWVPPSPNMPTPDTALVYPGTVLLEGTNISEGRGTTRPFELAGAPWIDPYDFASSLSSAGLPGVAFRPASFRPTFDKHAGDDCGGIQIHVTDRTAFRPVLTAVALIESAYRLYPEEFAWLDPPYEYETVKPPIDVIFGGPGLREGLAAGMPPSSIASAWAGQVEAFLDSVAGCLLYE